MKISKILIGIDDSTYAHNAAAYGFDLARTHQAVVGLAHIIEPVILQTDTTDSLSGIPIGGTLSPEELAVMQAQSGQSEEIVDRTVGQLGQGVEVVKFTQYGLTAEGIISCAKEFNADLIVIGTHKRSGIERLLMGSIAEYVVRHAEIPVLVVPFV